MVVQSDDDDDICWNCGVCSLLVVGVAHCPYCGACMPQGCGYDHDDHDDDEPDPGDFDPGDEFGGLIDFE